MHPHVPRSLVPLKPGDRVSAILASTLSPHEKLLAICISQHLNRTGTTWLNVSTLERETSLSRSTLFRLLATAEAAGWLVRSHHHRHASTFRIEWALLPT